jgi:hypothetical protein
MDGFFPKNDPGLKKCLGMRNPCDQTREVNTELSIADPSINAGQLLEIPRERGLANAAAPTQTPRPVPQTLPFSLGMDMAIALYAPGLWIEMHRTNSSASACIFSKLKTDIKNLFS